MKKLLIVLFCVILVTGLFLTSCRREEPPPPVTPPVEEPVTPPPPPPPPPEPEPEPEPPVVVEEVPVVVETIDITREKSVDPDRPAEPTGGSFWVALDADPTTLDPHFASTAADFAVSNALFEGLLVYDPKTGRSAPGLAESWKMTEDGKVFTFHLREASWSDGTAITAQTVVDSWLRALDPEVDSPIGWYLGFIKGAEEFYMGEAGADAVHIKALDDRTLEVELAAGLPYFAEVLPHFAYSVVPVHAIEQHGSAWTDLDKLVVNGPFKLTQWIPNFILELAPNSGYWDAQNVFLDEVIFRHAADASKAYELYQDGGADWITMIPPGKDMSGRDDFFRLPYLAAELQKHIQQAGMAEGDARVQALADAQRIFEVLDAGRTPLYSFHSVNLIDTDVWGGWHPNPMGFHPLKDIYLR